jgi:hypothetical protein
MKCPHRLEPNQIQGLDAERILPVIQWLLSQLLETRLLESDRAKRNAVGCFSRSLSSVTPDDQREDARGAARKAYVASEEGGKAYGPRRRFMPHARPAPVLESAAAASADSEIKMQHRISVRTLRPRPRSVHVMAWDVPSSNPTEIKSVQRTLLEFGYRYGSLGASSAVSPGGKTDEGQGEVEDEELLKSMRSVENSTARSATVGSIMGQQVDEISKVWHEAGCDFYPFGF